jgi:hypothetical protein
MQMSLVRCGWSHEEGDRDAVRSQVALIGREIGVEVVDLVPAMKSAYQGSQLDPYFRNDLHWTATGHRAAARAIEPLLQTFDAQPNVRVAGRTTQ